MNALKSVPVSNSLNAYRDTDVLKNKFGIRDQNLAK
jgi:hypothetical protein